MVKIEQSELDEIKKEFEMFIAQNNSVFKAAFLVACKHNFQDLYDSGHKNIPSDQNIIKLIRNSDNRFLVIRLQEIEKTIIQKTLTANFSSEE